MTIHETVALQTLLKKVSIFLFKALGWKVVGKKPSFSRYVVIAAPHTSNWDFFYTLCLSFIFRINPKIMMKDSWFFGPIGAILRWLGALAIDRSKANNVVEASIEKFKQNENMILVVPPTGTRKHVVKWKTGFYHIAYGAGVPIVLGFLDYRIKIGGLGPTFKPSGDINADMMRIQSFYIGITGKNS